MIKNIVFDMGGVLIDFDPIRSVKNHFASEDRNAVLANIFRSKEWSAMDKGDISVEEALKKTNNSDENYGNDLKHTTLCDTIIHENVEK